MNAWSFYRKAQLALRTVKRHFDGTVGWDFLCDNHPADLRGDVLLNPPS